MSTAADDVDLFVSYASPDRAWATWVDHTLREAGYTTRCEPGDVDGGTSLASLIGAGRPRFGRVVLLWSPHARRRLLLDGARWNDARSIGLVTPVVVGACPLPDALAGSDTIDLTDHHDGDGAAQALIEALTATVPPTTPADRAAGAAAANQATAARYPARDDLVLSPLVPARDASFVGREGELGRLAAGLDGDAGDAVLIRGLAGSGMTALAVEHVHRSLADADIIWWIRADLTETALGDLGELGHQLGWHVEGRSAGDAAELVRLRLASLDRRWLLVIDGVDDPELLARLRPASGNGQVVVTSHGLPEDLADVATVALGRLSDEHATALVHERLPGADPDAVDRLVGRVGGHALALDRSLAYLVETGTSIDAYLTMLDADGWAAIDSTATTRTLHRVLSTSVRRAADAGPLTRAVLGVVAVLDDDDIPRSLFTDGCAAIDELASATPTDIDEAIAGLERLSLIEVDGTDVHAHHLTQEVAAAAFGRPDLAVALLNAAVSTVDDASLRDVWQPLVPHAIALLERIDESGEPTTTAARLARALSTHLSGRGFYFSAFDHMELATSWLEQLVDTADGELVSARAELSTCCSQIGAHGEALELARQVLELRERIGGPDHLDTLRAVNNLAVRNLELGRYAEALPLAHRAIDGLEATVGADDPNTLTARGNLSIIATQMGDHDTAIEVATSVVDTRVQLLGPAHLDTVRARNNLSVCLSAAGRLTAALEVIEEAMGAMEVALGGDHPETVTVRYNLSICHRQLGDVDNAIRLAERVVHDRERLLGSEHPDTIRARDNLSNCHGRVGNYVSAFFLSKRALFDGVQVLGLHHPDTVAMREWNQHIAKQLKRRRRPQRLLSALSRSAHT